MSNTVHYTDNNRCIYVFKNSEEEQLIKNKGWIEISSHYIDKPHIRLLKIWLNGQQKFMIQYVGEWMDDEGLFEFE